MSHFDKIDTSEAEGMTERLGQMANLVADLYRTVSVMTTLYYEDDALNDVQPASFPSIIPASLDEWQHGIAANFDDWKALFDDHLRQDREARERSQRDAVGYAEEQGFEHELGGGGDVTLSHYGKKASETGARIGISGHDGNGFPTLGDWFVCYYPPAWNGEPLQYDVRSGGAIDYYQAIAGALALLEAAERD